MRTIFIAAWHNNAKTYPWSLSRDNGAAANWTTEFAVVNPILDSVIRTWIPWFRLVKVPVWLNLNQRVKYINSNSRDGDVCIEFHLDSAPNADGCTTFYFTGSTYAQAKATTFQQEYTRVSGIRWRGVKGDTTSRFGRLGFIRDTKPLALLVELGFITSTKDIATIQKYGAAAIIAGIKKII